MSLCVESRRQFPSAAALENRRMREQGIAGIVSSAVMSVITELLGILFVASLGAWLLGVERGSKPLKYSGWAAAAITAFLAPLELLVFLAIAVVLTILATGATGARAMGLWALAAISTALLVSLLLVPLFSAPWLPLEKMAQEDSAGEKVTMLRGYILGESSGFISFLDDNDRKIRSLTKSVTTRRTCRPKTSIIPFHPSAEF